MTNDTGRSPSGRACGPSDLSRSASQPEALVPNAATHPMADMLRAVAVNRADCGQTSIAAHLNAAADTMDDLYGALARAVELIDTAYGESTADEFRSALADRGR